MTHPLLEVRGLRTEIATETGTVTVLDDVSFSLSPNEVLCVVGESGSGKSVTMLSVMRLMDERITTYTGQVLFEGNDLLALAPRKMRQVRGAGIAMIFQDPMTALNPVYPIGWQIAEQLRAHGDLSAGEAKVRALELLRTVGISDPDRRIAAYPHELSGGMRQRVMIALALSCEPRVLIADEPTTALDVTIQAQILDLIARLKDETGMAIMLVTHDMGVVAELADRVQVMYGGRIVEQGSVEDIFERPQHPYTRGLLASIPRLDRPRPRRLSSIPGSPATAGQTGEACVFIDRCPHRYEPCALQPALFLAAAGHRAACHLLDDKPTSPDDTVASTGGDTK
jgi:oligopeptide/dipeptide ABC transporter ATP-binding protein